MKIDINGSVKTIGERIEDINDSIERCRNLSEMAKSQISDHIVFGRIFITSIEEWLKAHETYEQIHTHFKMIEIGSQEYTETLNVIAEFPKQEPQLKIAIEENSRLIKSNNELKNRMIVLIEHTFNEYDKFPYLIIKYLRN